MVEKSSKVSSLLKFFRGGIGYGVVLDLFVYSLIFPFVPMLHAGVDYKPLRYYYPDIGALDLDIDPEEAYIYIDGELVGIADQFDGWPGYLWLKKGVYDLVIYYPGRKTISKQITVVPGVVIDIEYKMRKGISLLPEELISKDEKYRKRRLERYRAKEQECEDNTVLEDDTLLEIEKYEDDIEIKVKKKRFAKDDGKYGWVDLKIEPEEAAVYVNGNFVAIAKEISRMKSSLSLPAGVHEIEVIHPDYPKMSLDVEVREGETVVVEVDLVEEKTKEEEKKEVEDE